MKKYLKTVEDIEALRNTDTKIYSDGTFWYYMFVNGVLCSFSSKGDLQCYNVTLGTCEDVYIEIEDNPLEGDIGKLGWFWDDDEDDTMVDILENITEKGKYKFEAKTGSNFKHFRPLTISEVQKYTGYKVVKEA